MSETTESTTQADGPMHATLLINVAKWAAALDPPDLYSDETPEAPALRLAALAKDAAGPFPVLVVAHRVATRRFGDVDHEAFFETRRFDDAPSLIDWLAELEVKHDVVDGQWATTLEFHRLAMRPRHDEVDYFEDDLLTAERESLADRVKLKVADLTGDKRKADALAAQARAVARAELTRQRELAKLAELRAKYKNAGPL